MQPPTPTFDYEPPCFEHLTRHPRSYGKFDTQITELLYGVSMESWQDEEEGTTDDIGWHALFRGSFDRDALARAVRGARGENGWNDEFELGYCEARALRTMAGAILLCTDSGAVYSQLYATEAQLEEAWQGVRDEYEKFFTVTCEVCGEDYQDYEDGAGHEDCPGDGSRDE